MSEIDKEQLYGRYQKQEDKRAALGMKMAHKALDIPEDDMQINANKTTTGIGTLGVLGVAGLSALIPGALAAYMMLKPAADAIAPAPTKPPAQVAPVAPGEDYWIEIPWEMKDGKLDFGPAKKSKS